MILEISHADPAPQALFNGKNLQNWQVVSTESFVHHGKVSIEREQLRLAAGQPGTGLRYLGKLPRANYEISLEARREAGFDFFCGLTFPVGTNYCTFVAGGWDGDVTGLSNINQRSAADNETTRSISFEQHRWYTFKIRVEPQQITVWMDGKLLSQTDLRGKTIGIRDTMQAMIPLGLCTWYTQAGVRNITLARLKASE